MHFKMVQCKNKLLKKLSLGSNLSAETSVQKKLGGESIVNKKGKTTFDV